MTRVNRREGEVPAYRANLYSTEAVLHPYPHYRRLRDLGAVVWLPAHRVYALPRYAECRTALLDDAAFRSTEGVALNPVSNRLSRGTTLASDGAEHDRRRKLLAHRLLPRALAAMADQVGRTADELVAAAVRRGEVDGAELAAALPLSVVPDLVGWPPDRRDRLIEWAGATFDVLGPANRRAVGGIPRAVHMLQFARQVVRRRSALPGSLADELLVAVDNGLITRADCRALMVDYLGPAIDTTMSAISTALQMFATNPDQWQLLRGNPGRIPNAVNEIVRYESPVRAFGRKLACDYDIGGTRLKAGSRVLVIFASANRDEREWDDPDVFDVTRDAGRHLGFGKGAHACAGQALARLEVSAFLTALADRVERIELTGTPKWALNNIVRRHDHLPIRLVPTAG